MVVWKLKSCPRCSGDMFMIRENDGWYTECLECGYQRDVSNIVAGNPVNKITVLSRFQTPQKSFNKTYVSKVN